MSWLLDSPTRLALVMKSIFIAWPGVLLSFYPTYLMRNIPMIRYLTGPAIGFGYGTLVGHPIAGTIGGAISALWEWNSQREIRQKMFSTRRNSEQ